MARQPSSALGHFAILGNGFTMALFENPALGCGAQFLQTLFAASFGVSADHGLGS
jgi:hypothetical protein